MLQTWANQTEHSTSNEQVPARHLESDGGHLYIEWFYGTKLGKNHQLRIMLLYLLTAVLTYCQPKATSNPKLVRIVAPVQVNEDETDDRPPVPTPLFFHAPLLIIPPSARLHVLLAAWA